MTTVFHKLPSEIVLGDPNADWRAGLGINLTYKKINLNVVVEHSQGGEFSPRTLHVLNRFGTTQETANRVTLTEDLVTMQEHYQQVLPFVVMFGFWWWKCFVRRIMV